MSNRRKAKLGEVKTVQPGPGPAAGCPCCRTLGLADYQPVVPSTVVLDCCEPCHLALAMGTVHPHAVPHLHWHPRPDGTDGWAEQLCPADGVVTQTCVVDDHRDPDTVAEGQRLTHDALVEGLGGLRASGVWWTHHLGSEARERVEQLHAADSEDPRVGEVRQLTLDRLEANKHAVFIVAWCVATDPAALAAL